MDVKTNNKIRYYETFAEKRKKEDVDKILSSSFFFSRLKILIYLTVMYTRTFTIKTVQFL